MSEMPPESPDHSDSPKSEHPYGMEMIGEPVAREDGTEITVFKTDAGIQINIDGMTTYYPDSEVEEFGEGDWRRGVGKITQDIYRNDPPNRGTNPVTGGPVDNGGTEGRQKG